MLHRFELLYQTVIFALHGVPEIPIELKSKPELCRHSQYSGKPECRIGRNTSPSFSNFI